MLIGVVEEIGKAEKRAFNNLDELWDILNADGRGGNRPRKAGYRKKRANPEETMSQ
jgi:hypothetical protein